MWHWRTWQVPCRSTLLRDTRNRSDTRRLGITAYQSGRHAEALALLRTVCDDAGDYSNLGIVLHALGRDDEAEAAYRKSIALDAGLASAHCNQGNLLQARRRDVEATAAFRVALALQPDFGNAWTGLGHSLHRQGQLSDAVNAFRNAARCSPSSAEAQNNLGTLLFALEQNEAARAALGQALILDPACAKAHGNLGALYARCGCSVAAEASSRAAIALAPEEHRWLTNLGVALFGQGRQKEAEACYRQALALRPDYAIGHGNLLFALSYRTNISPETIFAEYQAWERRHASHLATAAPPFALDRTPGRRLRVGYVSPDFRQHAVALFAEPLLAAHDRSNVELYCYSDVAAQDVATARFHSLADHWRGTLGLSDAQLAETIRADQIDVLVDLAGHSAGNRLLTFARRAAPVQVAYLLGHGYTTGLLTMDAFLADAILAPDGADALFSERIVRLPRIPLTYAPPADMPPVATLPALANGFVTFGHFGRAERLNDTVIETWARILQGVPRSRLMLNNRPYQEAAFRSLIQARFATHGITADRLDLVYTPRSRTHGPHMAASTSRWIHSRTMPAQRRSRHYGKACLSSPSQDGRRSVASARASCMRSDSTIGLPPTLTTTLRVRLPQHPIWRLCSNCAAACAPALRLLRCTMRMASPAPWSHVSHALGRVARRRHPAAASPLYARRSDRRQRLAHRMLRRDPD